MAQAVPTSAGHQTDGEPAALPIAPELHGRLRVCGDCGLLLLLPTFQPGTDCLCPRCAALLHRDRHFLLTTPLALAVASLILCGVTLTTPFLTVRFLGRTRGSTIESGAWSFLDDGLWLLAAIVLGTVVLVPLLRLCLRLVVLGGLSLRQPPPWLFRPLRWHGHLGVWSMLEIFLLGAVVSYIRLSGLVEVQFGPAAYCLGVSVLGMTVADACFEQLAVWNRMEMRGAMASAPQTVPKPTGPQDAATRPSTLGCSCCRGATLASPGTPCPRCGTPLHHRKPASVSRTWALIIAAAILYVPANLCPVMAIVTFGRGSPHTIVGGIIEFVATGYWPLALLLCFASVVVPLAKLAGLSVMLLQIRRGSIRALRQRTRLYRLIAVLGRWSMVDIFVVAVLVALLRFGGMVSVTAEIGAACFGAVVVLTMLATESFDPRLMWDAVEARLD